MTAAALPADEQARLQSLRDLMVLDSEPEPLFDSLARMASELCGTPIALVSLVDAERQWFKANVGLPGVNQTPRDVAFCAHAIHGEALFEVPDAARDPRFADNPLVTGRPDIRFYAGAPVHGADGRRVGTLRVIDRQARQLDAGQARRLQELAQLVSQALAMRRQLIDRSLAVRSDYEQRLSRSEERHRRLVESQSELVSLSDPDGRLVYVNPAYARHFGLSPQAMMGRNLFDFVDPDDQAAVRGALQAVTATGGVRRQQNRVRGADGMPRWIDWTNSLLTEPDGRQLLHGVGRDVTERVQLEQRLADSERFVRQITDRLPVRIAYLDRALRFRFVNEAHCQRFGRDRPDILGRTREEMGVVGGRAEAAAAAQRALQGQAQRFEYDELMRGEWRRIESHLTPDVDADGQVRGLFAIGNDVTERSAIARALQLQVDTLHATIEAVPAPVAVIGADQRYRHVNSAFERWIGRTQKDIVGRTMTEVLGADEVARRREWVQRVLAGETVQFDTHDPGRLDGSHMSLSFVPLRRADGTVDGFVGLAQDITRHKREAVRLHQLALRDPLTGLLNRAGFEDMLERWMADQPRSDVAVLYIDLDRFKPVNDAHGHAVGDEVLRGFAQRLRQLVRPTDAVARLGGDEFAIALAGVHRLADAHRVADKVVAAARLPFDVRDRRLHISASVGVAFGLERESGWGDLVARADAMLYGAKAAGRGRSMGEAP